MKSLVLSILVSLFPLLGSAQSYEKLWKQVEQEEGDGKPQSAYATVQKILKKALADGQRGQVLSARLRSAGLHQEWAPDSFFADVAELEALRTQEQRPEARAVYASILAEIYAGNRSRSQASGLALTSDNIREWTREQYDSAAVSNWRQSLENLDALAAARSKDWLPFVAQGTNSAYFRHDLLHILWQRCRDHRTTKWSQPAADLSALGMAVRDLYIRQGNREAALLVDLDLVKNDIAPLQALREQYASLPLCTEVYLRLLDTDTTEAQKVAWCEEAISRYPRYARIGEVKNRLNDLRRPQVIWHGGDVYYPGKHYGWRLAMKNATAVTMTVYRIKDEFNDSDIEKSKLSVAEYLRRNGTQVQEINHSIAPSDALVTTEDTLNWQAPAPGLYAVLYRATTSEKEAQQKTTGNLYHIFRVTRLKTLTRIFAQDALEVIVVDAESGQPVPGATVELYDAQQSAEQRLCKGSLQTDEEGRVRCTLATRRMDLRVFKGDDTYLPDESLWNTRLSFRDVYDNTSVQLYTDRAIYRPGQTVHVSGVVYVQNHWDANVLVGQEYELLLRDANWKEVGRQKVTTDAMGVFAADFTLPEGGLAGNYTILAEMRTRVTFRVEEYKRPTFEVTMDKAPALQWPQDSITLTGKALGYNGVPVRDARVTGHYQFTYPYFWWYRHDNSPQLPIDTVSTDEMGVFYVRVPLKDIPAESLRYGLVLSVDVEVLSAAGETRLGSGRVPLCTTPLRLNITMAEQQDRDRLTPPAFSLLTSTGQPAQGEISCAVYPAGSPNPVASDIVIAVPEGTPEGLTALLRSLPSGDYELRATAKAGNDTASAKASFYLFSMADQRLPRRAESWLYSPTDTFSLQHPARIQVGSSFEDVAFYYSLVGKNGIIKNELLQLSDELRIIEIPYQPDYGDGVTVHFAFVKGGKSYILRKTLKLALPDKELRWQWTSFRDRLHPGEAETWTLRLTAPDGSPVAANLMATLYDASLDQLKSHSWSLLVDRIHRVRALPWRSRDFYLYSASEVLFFPMKDYRADALAFDAFDSRWFNGLFFRANAFGVRRVGSVLRQTSVKALESEDSAVYNHVEAAAAPAALSKSDVELALKGTIGGLTLDVDVAESEEAMAEGELMEPASAAVRTNFSETAFFMPRLHSNPATGEVTMSFTLPESLTTWQFLGVAHTADMMTATLQAQTIARKELMARLYLPRFLRAGDASTLRAVVQNLTDTSLAGQLRLEVFDPETEKVLLRQQAAFETTAQGEAVLAFDYTPTEDYPLVAVRLTAESAQFSDGEQHYLPILSAKEWITESVELQADGPGTFTTDLSTLFNKDNATATQRRLTVEYTTHPIWNVVQALPALREPQHDDVLSLTSVLYSNILAAHIAGTTPRLKTIIELWKQQGVAQSPLADKEDLKQLILDETPWLREADKDSQRRAQIIDLFNENLLNSRVDATLEKLRQRQEADGGFAWFPGMRSSELMTRLVSIELTHLRALTDDFSLLPSETVTQLKSLLTNAVRFVAQANAERVQEMKKAEAKGSTIQTGSLMHLDYIYISQRAGVELTKSQQADVRYLLDHLKGSVAGMSNNERAMAAIVLNGAGRSKDARLYFDSMKEHLTTTAAHGTFFDYAGGSFTPTGHKVIIHTAAMEAVRELASDDSALNSGLRRWLLQQKRTQMWESSICTANAIYALLYGTAAAEDLQSTAKDRLTLNYGKKKTVVSASSDASSVAALGYLRETYTDGAAPKSITVERRSAGEAWGAVYAQYLTPIADATAHAAGLTIRREVSSTAPRLGDKFTTRYIITADRDYEYVCLRADRAAAAEPAEQLSGYRYQGGLGYYRAVRDAHTDYFFDHLPKGTYVLEETAYIDRTGRYTTGLATIRCLYAPEYGGNTPAAELTIGH